MASPDPPLADVRPIRPVRDYEPSQPSPSRTQSEHPSLLEYWDVLRRRRFILLAVFIAVLATTIIFTLNQTPTFRATTAIIVEPPGMAGLTSEEPAGQAAKFYQTEYEVMRSKRVVQLAFELGGLMQDPAFADAADPVEAFRGTISISPVTDSSVVRLSVEHQDRDVAMKLADVVAQVYIDHSTLDRRSSSRNAFDWLSVQIEKMQRDVEASERALLDYKGQSDLVSVAKRKALLEERLSSLSHAHDGVSQEVLNLETVLGEVGKLKTSPELVESLPRDLETTHVRMLKEELSQLSVQRASIARKYKPKHPDVVSIDAQIGIVKDRLLAEAEKIYESVDMEHRIATSKASSLAERLTALKTELMTTDEQSIRFRTLQREADSNRQIYDVLLQRLREADIGGSVSGENIRVLDVATAPFKPYKPKPKLNLAIGLLGGLLVGGVCCFVVDSIDSSLKTEEDIAAHLDEPLLGLIPKFRTAPKLSDELPESLLQGYDNVKTKLRLYAVENDVKTLLVTSAVHMEGKTLSAALLAMSFARAGFRVLLVDADMFRADLAKRFEIKARHGLSDYLTDGRHAGDLLRSTKFANLFILPAGPVPTTPGQLLGTQRMRELVDSAKTHYDFVVIDSPPMSAALDVSFLAAMVDGVAVVVKSQRVSRRLAKKVVAQLKSARANVLGVILTAAEASKEGASHYYYYGAQARRAGATSKPQKSQKKRPKES